MNDIVLTSLDTDILIHRIAERTVELLSRQKTGKQEFIAPEDSLDDFITKDQAKDLLKVSPTTLWRWEQSGKIKSYSLGGKRFYRRSELTEILTALKK